MEVNCEPTICNLESAPINISCKTTDCIGISAGIPEQKLVPEQCPVPPNVSCDFVTPNCCIKMVSKILITTWQKFNLNKISQRYIQPVRIKSFKPESCYQRPGVPMESQTIYKNSYLETGPNLSKTKPIRPQCHIQMSSSKMDPKTVTNMSFPGHFCIPQQKPLKPRSRTLLGKGPMQQITTNKHDYVAKPVCRRSIILPISKMLKTCASLDKETVQKLSYMPPNMNKFSKAVSFKPIAIYQQPQIPMEIDTIQKLSYLPIGLKPREQEFPWNKKIKFTRPCISFENETTYKLSYFQNLGVPRTLPCWPAVTSKLLTAHSDLDHKTVYKESYFGTTGCKPELILPKSQFMFPDIKMDCGTVQKMSFPGHLCIQRRQPIYPNSSKLFAGGKLEDRTIQKLSYDSKPFSRRPLMKPFDTMPKSCCSLERETTNRLSYMLPNMECRRQSFKPCVTFQKSDVKMDLNTTQKLSYLPVCPPVKECLPWAIKPKYRAPVIPMETRTIQNMSYGPPGKFIEDSSCCPTIVPPHFPRAGIVN